jgi:hypothetical protein
MFHHSISQSLNLQSILFNFRSSCVSHATSRHPPPPTARAGRWVRVRLTMGALQPLALGVLHHGHTTPPPSSLPPPSMAAQLPAVFGRLVSRFSHAHPLPTPPHPPAPPTVVHRSTHDALNTMLDRRSTQRDTKVRAAARSPVLTPFTLCLLRGVCFFANHVCAKNS